MQECNLEVWFNMQENGNSEVVLPKVPFSACLAKWAGEEVMGDYFSAAVGHKTQAKRFSRIANFPPYLMLQMNRRASLAAATAAWCNLHDVKLSVKFDLLQPNCCISTHISSVGK